MPSKILLKCPACSEKLKSGWAVVGKKGECTKCRRLFRAPTAAMHKSRRIKQIGISAAIVGLLTGIPAWYMIAARNTRIKIANVEKKLAGLEESAAMFDLLSQQSKNNLIDRLKKLKAPVPDETLNERVFAAQSLLIPKPVEVAVNQPEGENEGSPEENSTARSGKSPVIDKPLTAADLKLATRDAPLINGDAKVFFTKDLTEGLPVCTVDAFVTWMDKYSRFAKTEYSASIQSSFREKGEFETTQEYNSQKKNWQDEQTTRPMLVQEKLFKAIPPQWFLIDDVPVLDTGDGYNADGEFWSHLKAVYMDDPRFNISRVVRAVGDETLPEAESSEYAVDETQQLDDTQQFHLSVSDIHHGEYETEDSGPIWRIATLDNFYNLPISLESAKKFRSSMNSGDTRMGLVVYFPGESRFKNPKVVTANASPEEIDDHQKMIWEYPFGVALDRIVIYDQATGEIFFSRKLGSPDWKRMQLPPVGKK